MYWLYDAGKVICYVRSRLWQNYIFIINILLYLSLIVGEAGRGGICNVCKTIDEGVRDPGYVRN